MERSEEMSKHQKGPEPVEPEATAKAAALEQLAAAQEGPSAGRSWTEAQAGVWDQVADWFETTAHRLRAGEWDHIADDVQQGLHAVAATGRALPWRPREFRVTRDHQADELTLTVVWERPVPADTVHGR